VGCHSVDRVNRTKNSQSGERPHSREAHGPNAEVGDIEITLLRGSSDYKLNSSYGDLKCMGNK